MSRQRVLSAASRTAHSPQSLAEGGEGKESNLPSPTRRDKPVLKSGSVSRLQRLGRSHLRETKGSRSGTCGSDGYRGCDGARLGTTRTLRAKGQSRRLSYAPPPRVG